MNKMSILNKDIAVIVNHWLNALNYDIQYGPKNERMNELKSNQPLIDVIIKRK